MFAGAADGDIFVHDQFSTGEQDGAEDAGGVNRVAIVCVNQRLTQRARAAVIGVCDGDRRRVNALHACNCCAEQREEETNWCLHRCMAEVEFVI